MLPRPKLERKRGGGTASPANLGRYDMLDERNERLELITQVASLYYEEGLSQEQIARMLKLSKATISRLMRRARELGIVEITVHKLLETDRELESALTSTFGLRLARVMVNRAGSYEDRLRSVGALAARYVDSVVFKNAILGISWGTAVYHTVNSLSPRKRFPVLVVQMIGAIGAGNPQIDGPDLARRLSSIYGGDFRYLHAPLVVGSEEVRDALSKEERIRETLDLSEKADIALVGIGSLEPSVSSLLRAGYLTKENLKSLKSQGAVGDVCARHYDIQGNVLDIEINRRVVGISLEALHGIKRVIGVAVGEKKAPSILGALRGRHVNILITDDITARRVLELQSGIG